MLKKKQKKCLRGFNIFLFFPFIIFLSVSVFGFNHRKKIAPHKSSHGKYAFHNTITHNKFPAWMLSQIDADLTPFKKFVLSQQVIDEAMEHYLRSDVGLNNSFELTRCQIRSGKVSLHNLFPIPTHSRAIAILQALTHLINLTPFPDIDFILCTGDSLNREAASYFSHIPILSFAKNSQDRISVLIPDCEAVSDTFLETVCIDTAYAYEHFPWQTKKETLFWRGATTGTDNAGGGSLNSFNYQEFPRIKLVLLSSVYPSLIDAKLCILAQITDPPVYDLLAPYKGRSVPIVDHLQYKYQLLIDGNTCAYSRAYWQLFSGCLMFKQTSPNIQWYYATLQPYVHYIPVAYDLSDLVEKIEWAKNHDTEAKKIADNALSLARENLKKEDIYLYLYLFLHRYAELFSIPI